MKNLDYFIQIAENRLSNFGEYSCASFDSELNYLVDTNEEIDDNVTWDTLKDALIQDGYYYNYQDESIVTPQVATDMGLDDEYWDDEEEDNEVDSIRILFQDTVSSIENDFKEKLTINSEYLKSNNLKFHSFQLNEMNLIQLGKLMYEYYDIKDWVDDEEINLLINDELRSFNHYLYCGYDNEPYDDEPIIKADDDNYMCLGFDIACHIINNPKLKECYKYNGNIIYVFQSLLDIYNLFDNDIKEFMINIEKYPQKYVNKSDLTDEEKEEMAYEYANKVLLLKYQ